MPRIYVLKESTGRFAATMTLLNRLSEEYNTRKQSSTSLFVRDFSPDEIPGICGELMRESMRHVREPRNNPMIFIILGENDIVKWGQQLRNLAPGSAVHFYPTLLMAMIETSKIYCREILSGLEGGQYNPQYRVVCADDPELEAVLGPTGLNLTEWVIKCDGLASGKGVWVGGAHYETQSSGRELVLGALERGRVLLEERLIGQEFSLHSICYDGRVQHTPCVRDFKRRGSGDTGLNTGGMGTISYADGLMPFLTPDEYIECCRVNEWVADKIGFTGVLYGSFMKTDSGELKVIEYNCRPGDSEWINLAMLADVDIGQLVGALSDDNGNGANLVDRLISCLRFRPEASVCTYMVDKDYAISSNSGNQFTGEEYITLDTPCEPGVCGFFPAGIELISDGVTSSNRWLGCRRNKYKYSRPCRLMNVGATSADIDELIDIHAGLCVMVRGNRLDWRRDIPEFLRPSVHTPLSSVSSTPRFSQPVIDFQGFPEPTQQSYQSGQSYLSHLDNYNSIMDEVKREIDTTNREIALASSGRLELTGEIGDFANSVRYMFAGGDSSAGMTLICSVDGAGTKTKFMSDHPDRFRVLGHDVIIHNINDMLCNGGTPIAFLDYYGCDRLNPREFSEYIRGILEVCRSEGIPLIGGETAEMRGIYQPGECEVLGMLLGVALNGTRNGDSGRKCQDIGSGTLIYGIRSHGAHTNGFTKLREIQSQHEMPSEVYEYFCRPHRNYRPVFEALAHAGIHPVAKAHITGGGFTDNLMRVVASECQQTLKPVLEPWQLSREWEWVMTHSNMSWSEFTRVFNSGFGMCFMTNEPINRDRLPDDLGAEIQLLGAFMD
jgi:phosphoribosylaminoimidazole synthetase